MDVFMLMAVMALAALLASSNNPDTVPVNSKGASSNSPDTVPVNSKVVNSRVASSKVASSKVASSNNPAVMAVPSRTQTRVVKLVALTSQPLIPMTRFRFNVGYS